MAIIADILVACGAEGTHDGVSDVVENDFRSDIDNIVKLALSFQETSGEAVRSRDFMLVTAEGGEGFDDGRMEDGHVDFGYSSVSDPSVMRVVCTTDLGLGVEHFPRGRSDGEQPKTAILLKPKVALNTDEDFAGHGDNGTESPSPVTTENVPIHCIDGINGNYHSRPLCSDYTLPLEGGAERDEGGADDVKGS